MNEDNEKSALMPMEGDTWEMNGIPECIILSVGKETIEYVDEKIHYGPGVWDWDITKYKVMPKGSLKRYLCKTVPLDKEPIDWLYNINRIELASNIVSRHKRKMNRAEDLGDKDLVEVVCGSFKLSFNKSGEGMAKLININNKIEIEISLGDLWELGELAYNSINEEVKIKFNEEVNNE
jgi:hypothetical protein